MIQDNIYTLHRKIKDACDSSGRNSYDITIVAVTKTVSVDKIQDAYNAGLRHFGENKVQECIQKIDELPDDIQWHFVGHLQTNKVKFIIHKVSLIHSVDRLKLAHEIERQSEKHNIKTNILIQVNTSHESTKFGVSEEKCESLIYEVRELKHVTIKGLMTIGAFTNDTEKIRQCFVSLRQLRDVMKNKFCDIDFNYLSMGMTSDYLIAIEEGANMLRIGTAIFGERIYT